MKPSTPRTARQAATLLRTLFDALAGTAGISLVVLLAVDAAHAGEHRYPNADPAYRAECGSCHVAYPPALLSAAAWTAVFDRLDRHYGVDASLDAVTAARLRADAVAGSDRRGRNEAATADELPRISTQRWFLKEHREVQGSRAPRGMKSMADCATCHRQAASGDFSEATLRVPRAPQTRITP